MEIHDVGMTRKHFQQGNIERVRMVVLHATAGRYPGDYNWLRQGGSAAAPVSVHYYIDKQGKISRMVAEKDIAWHAGPSTWVVDGERIKYAVGCNPVSIGIELENLNDGRDPYPQVQYEAALWLTRRLVQEHNIPRSQLVRHLDIAPRRKTDPRAFPWERFVIDVYAADAQEPAPQPIGSANGKPVVPAEEGPHEQPEQPLPARQLRDLLVDLAYRAADTSCPDGWPLLKAAVSRQTGMPVVAMTPAVGHEAEPDMQARAMTLPGQEPLVLEAYGRDLFYAPLDDLTRLTTLSSTEEGLLRDVLLYALFKAADPASGFRPDWAFHQFYLKHQPNLGVPIGPNHRLNGTTGSGQAYVCQHFSLDTLCAPVGEWKTIVRLSDLTRKMYDDDPHGREERELRALLLDDLFQQRTGHTFDREALFCRYAIRHELGAPLGNAEYLEVTGHRLVAMPFALDVIYAQVPADGDWRGVSVNELPAVLGDTSEPDEQRHVARLSTLLAEMDDAAAMPAVLGGTLAPAAIAAPPVCAAALVGAHAAAPACIDLTDHVHPGASHENGNPECVVIYAAAGPVSRDLARVHTAEPTPWHYYIEQRGSVTRLRSEQLPISTLNGSNPRRFARRALTIAVEGGTQRMPHAQRVALGGLLAEIMRRYGLQREHLLTASAAAQKVAPEPQPAPVAAQEVGGG